MSLKNKYFGIIYKGCLDKKPVRKIHKELYDATINNKVQNKYLLAFAIKLTNKSRKLSADSSGALAILLLNLFKRDKSNDKAKKIINFEVSKQAENEKNGRLEELIDKSRDNNQWFYLASSHSDCAEDHKAWQGRLYVDEKAPKPVIDYAKTRGLYTMQWVISKPVWFVTRPNCRHYFVSLTIDQVMNKSLRKLRRKYKTHSKKGNYDLQTPQKHMVEEYEDRLKLLRELYRQYPTRELKIEIDKTQLLVKKWKREI